MKLEKDKYNEIDLSVEVQPIPDNVRILFKFSCTSTLVLEFARTSIRVTIVICLIHYIHTEGSF